MFSVIRPAELVIVLGLCLTISRAQAPASGPEEAESYEVYSAVLHRGDSNRADWKILDKTYAFAFCPVPAPDQDSLYRPTLDDYTRKNKTTVPLERKFGLENYLLVSDRRGAGNTTHGANVILSAVGFNPDRTRAAVCFWIVSSGTCSVLIKSDGAWTLDKGWHGNGCGWAY